MNSRVVRFGLIGIANTLIDLGLFYVLSSLADIHYFYANIMSTSAALIFSFFMNARYTFSGKRTPRSVVLFLGVTLSGLWLLQPGIIALVHPLVSQLLSVMSFTIDSLLVAKVLATGASLVWNYVGYKYLVFPESNPGKISHRQ